MRVNKKILLIPVCIFIVVFVLVSFVLMNDFDNFSVTWDYENDGAPKFVDYDYINLSMITSISKLRSAVGHDYSDEFESCRSMKHYYTPFEEFINNSIIEIYSPVDGFIEEIFKEENIDTLNGNFQIRIRSDRYPAFLFVLFHIDPVSSEIISGKSVSGGELIGYARMYYPDEDTYAANSDVAVQVKTPQGLRYISFFETMTDDLFQSYINRGVEKRSDFIISKEDRDANPIGCNGEWFTIHEDDDALENWVYLN